MFKNHISLTGKLVTDPEFKEIRPGLVACKLTIYTEHKIKSKDGKETIEKCAITTTVWNKQAERCKEFLKKDSVVELEGRLKLETWIDKVSQKERSRLVIAPEGLEFDETPLPKPKPQEPASDVMDTWDDSLPF